MQQRRKQEEEEVAISDPARKKGRSNSSPARGFDAWAHRHAHPMTLLSLRV